MTGMKFDMSGAAAVLEATAAIAELELPIQVVTVVGAVENLVSATGMRPDDVVRAANGKTIEITNTDAEGRLVLADCLHHARSLGATHVVDLATLTGAIVVALGDLHAGHVRARRRVRRAHPRRRRAGRRARVADAAARHLQALHALGGGRHDRTPRPPARAAPASPPASCRSSPARAPWAHLDIAGMADVDRDRGDGLGKGGTGWGVRLLVELAQSLC